jgi:hypothetical protein
MTKWLTLAGVGGASAPDLMAATHPMGVSAAAWETVSGGTALGVIAAPEYPWVIAAEGEDPDAPRQALARILAAVPPGDAGTPEMFEEIYRRGDAADIGGDGRDIFYARVTVREAVTEPLNDWYNNVHLPEVGAAGLVAGRRFRSADAAHTFLALYRLESLDVLRSDAINAVRGLGGFEDDVTSFARLEARSADRCFGTLD